VLAAHWELSPPAPTSGLEGPPVDRYHLVGQVIGGRFRVLGVRHAGPRSIVYEAEPPGVGNARRAFKLLARPEAFEPDALDRLRSFVDPARRVRDPFVETLYSAGLFDDELPYVLTEWLPLPTLAHVTSRTPELPVERALDILRGISRGLTALHDAGLFHGDLRPEHVLVSPAPTAGTVKLIDAGVGAILSGGPPATNRRSLPYLAPECVLGAAPSPASDVYALGVLAYALLAGRLPFSPEDQRIPEEHVDPIARLRWLHLSAAPMRPSQWRCSGGFPVSLERVVARAMAKAPAERFPDGGAFRVAMDAALLEPKLTPPPEEVAGEELAEVLTPAPAEVPAPAPPGVYAWPLWAWGVAGATAGVVAAVL